MLPENGNIKLFENLEVIGSLGNLQHLMGIQERIPSKNLITNYMYIVIFNPDKKNYGILETDKEYLAGFATKKDANIAANEAKRADRTLISYSIFEEIEHI